jgi:hypothetical protein
MQFGVPRSDKGDVKGFQDEEGMITRLHCLGVYIQRTHTHTHTRLCVQAIAALCS